jgi:hypothetical protein
MLQTLLLFILTTGLGFVSPTRNPKSLERMHNIVPHCISCRFYIVAHFEVAIDGVLIVNQIYLMLSHPNYK